MQNKRQESISAFELWYRALKVVKQNNGPANGTIATALVLLERLKAEYNLNFDDHIAKGGAQLKGASGRAVAEILKSFGETRPFAREGGRTNRGGQGELRPLFEQLAVLKLEALEENQRNEILTDFQQFLVQRVVDFHNRQKIRFVFDAKLSTWQIVHELLVTASNEGKAGFVAQHLVGAKLALRFPSISIPNESASTADIQTSRHGDFMINDTVFHVTVSPMQTVIDKCGQNLRAGYKATLLVLDSKLAWARQMCNELHHNQIAVESIESFVSQNIDEISAYSRANLQHCLSDLISIYNARVDEVETDKSLMIELPGNL